MTTATQDRRIFSVTTPLGPDRLLARAFHAEEALSELFEAKLDVLADRNYDLPFEQLLGRNVSVRIGTSDKDRLRHFHGLCHRVVQLGSEMEYTHYRLSLVPDVWQLTKRTQCRIFQQISVPDILRTVFSGFRVEYRLVRTFHPRDYCVQYRESDWNFAARLMEEEGIYFFFGHEADEHRLVIANHPSGHAVLSSQPNVTYRHHAAVNRHEYDGIYEFSKSQELVSGKVRLRDFCFEYPTQRYDTDVTMHQSVLVGQKEHKLNLGMNGKLEQYDYPGEFAQRFDGRTPGGANRMTDLEKIFDDGSRTARIRMEAEAAQAVQMEGASTCRQFTAGHKFSVTTAAGDKLTAPLKSTGSYVLTRVVHDAVIQDDYRSSSSGGAFEYRNTFAAIPADVTYRPMRRTEKPVVHGSQTAIVVGPAGEEIFTDDYGRVKVQFHWDRQGQMNADSSCWVRVSQAHAGVRFGGIDIPRVGQEVVVDFLEGDPDQPIIVGRVYNAFNPPPFDLPAKKMVSGLKSNSYPGGGGFNEFSMDDTKGNERMFIHAQYNQDAVVGNNRTARVAVDSLEEVGNNVAEKVGVDKQVQVGNNEATTIGNNQQTTVGNNIVITAGTSITLECGASRIHMTKAGLITISGTVIAVAGAANCTMTAPVTNVTGGILLTAVGTVTRVQGLSLVQVKGPKAEMEGTSSTIVAGGKVEVTAKGELTAKGSTIKLN